MFTNEIEKWIELALDADISEKDFWDMTFAEIIRVIESNKRKRKQQAVMDYRLANLIGYSVGRIHNKQNQMPEIFEMYPDLFQEEEIEERMEEKKIERFAASFIQYAQNYNRQFEEVESE